MARHVTRAGRARRAAGVLVVALVPLLVLALGWVALSGFDLRDLTSKAPLIGQDCPSDRREHTPISVIVAPEILSPVRALVGTAIRRVLPDGSCLQLNLTAQTPADTVGGASLLPVDQAPQIWIPDSSLWAGRVPQWRPVAVGSFASSPVVVATSAQAAAAQGWTSKPPTWAAALSGKLPIAMPDVATDAAALSAVLALWQSLGGGERAQQALAACVLATLRHNAPDLPAALQAARAGSAQTPVLPTSQRALDALNAGAAGHHLVPIHPSGADPALDYPILEPSIGTPNTDQAAALRVLLGALSGPSSGPVLSAAGLAEAVQRGWTSAGPAASGTPSASAAAASPSTMPGGATSSAVNGLAPAQQAAQLLQRIAVLSAPSRLLIVFDVSKSMAAAAGNGMSRIMFAATAAQLAGNLMPDRAIAGLWGFSRNWRGAANWAQVEPIAELGSPEGRNNHRTAMINAMFRMAGQLGGTGTALYATAAAAMDQMRRSYDPRAGNAVVLFTDGANVDPGGPSLAQTVARIRAGDNPAQRVRLICIGIGPDADLAALKQLADAGHGAAFLAKDPRQLPTVLFTVLNQRPGA